MHILGLPVRAGACKGAELSASEVGPIDIELPEMDASASCRALQLEAPAITKLKTAVGDAAVINNKEAECYEHDSSGCIFPAAKVDNGLKVSTCKPRENSGFEPNKVARRLVPTVTFDDRDGDDGEDPLAVNASSSNGYGGSSDESRGHCGLPCW